MKQLILLLCVLKTFVLQTIAAQTCDPNILLNLGYGDVRCYNADSKVPTPNIDKLATGGMRFTDAHSPCTVCTPSRYALMTGQMAFRVPRGGTVFQGVGVPSLIAPGPLTLPAMLKQQGYATAAVGKWHIGLTFRDQAGKAIHSDRLEDVQRVDHSRRIEGGPLDHGFVRFFGAACCPSTDRLYAFIDGDRTFKYIPDLSVADGWYAGKNPKVGTATKAVLFDLTQDPGETQSILPKPPSDAQRLSDCLARDQAAVVPRPVSK